MIIYKLNILLNSRVSIPGRLIFVFLLFALFQRTIVLQSVYGDENFHNISNHYYTDAVIKSSEGFIVVQNQTDKINELLKVKTQDFTCQILSEDLQDEQRECKIFSLIHQFIRPSHTSITKTNPRSPPFFFS